MRQNPTREIESGKDFLGEVLDEYMYYILLNRRLSLILLITSSQITWLAGSQSTICRQASIFAAC